MPEPDEWVQDNYRELVATTGRTWEEIAANADALSDPDTAAWARAQAAAAGVDVTPTDATATAAQSTRAAAAADTTAASTDTPASK